MSVHKLSRRDFLQHGLAAGAGLTLGLDLLSAARAGEGGAAMQRDDAAMHAFEPNAFVRIGSDNLVTVVCKHIEFGQGTFTGLPTLVADELDADWSQIRVVAAPADPSRFNNLNWGPFQATGGSSSMNNAFTQMRRAGATARAMLINAAAERWQVNPGEISVNRGLIAHRASGRSATFGELAIAAAAQSLPKNVALKTPDKFLYIGHHVPRTDQRAKTDGSAIYTQDFRLPGMLTAVVAHPPRFGGRVSTVDSSAAESIAGVERIITLASGVAVVAKNFWSAKKGRDALRITWDESAAFKLGSADVLRQFHELARRPGLIAHSEGDADAALAGAATVLESEFEFPYLAHAAMEPMNCVAQVTHDRCEMWYGVQSQSMDLKNISAALDIPPANIRLNMLYAGGSFGRRSQRRSDYSVEAALIAQALGDGTPVKLVWTREDDMRAGAYRPLNVHRIRGGLDADGRIVAWEQRIVGQSIFGADSKTLDRSGTEGAADLPYAIEHRQVEAHQPNVGVPILWWRSVGHSHTAFSTETFFDELAYAAGRDPYELRMELLSKHPRHRAVLERAAREAGWGKTMARGRGQGIAVHYAFKTLVAEVADVTVNGDGSYAVDKVTAAVDCGIAVNPDIIRAQIEGGIGYALAAVFSGAITLIDGIVQEDNFDTYPVLRLAQMPAIDVHILDSTEPPTGVGEPGVPPLAPAVANALFAATGKRLRSMPLRLANAT